MHIFIKDPDKAKLHNYLTRINNRLYGTCIERELSVNFGIRCCFDLYNYGLHVYFCFYTYMYMYTTFLPSPNTLFSLITCLLLSFLPSFLLLPSSFSLPPSFLSFPSPPPLPPSPSGPSLPPHSAGLLCRAGAGGEVCSLTGGEDEHLPLPPL